MRSVRQHLSFANVVSLLALFLAIGGGAYAAATATKNSVTSKSVKNNSLKGVDVLDDSLSGQDVNEGSLDLPAGPPGPKGDKGDPGQNGQPDTPQQILDKIKTVDGPDSGLDADTFDGRQLCATEGTLTLDDDLPPVGETCSSGVTIALDCVSDATSTTATATVTTDAGPSAGGFSGASPQASTGAVSVSQDIAKDAGIGGNPISGAPQRLFAAKASGSGIVGTIAAFAEATAANEGTCHYVLAAVD